MEEQKLVLASVAAAAATGLLAWSAYRTFCAPKTKGRKLLVSEPSLTDLEEKYLLQAYRSTFISGGAGSYKKRLENEFAALCECKHGVATANGTVAINLALKAAGLKDGDEVICPSFTYVASVAAIVSAGGVPVLVDCDEMGLIDPEAVESAITPKTKFIMAVHLYGHPADMDPITKIARDFGLLVVEDAAEAHGAKYKGRPVGSLGDVATFSFYANKVMTTGEGGIVVTNNSKLAKQMIFLRGHAMSPETRFWHTDVGYNYRLSNLLCAIGVAQLERFPQLFAGRKRVIDTYKQQLDGCCGIKINPHLSDVEPSPWTSSTMPWLPRPVVQPQPAKMTRLACVWLPEEYSSRRDAICEELESRGVETRPFFYPVHDMPPYKKYRMIDNGSGGRTNRIAARGFNIPTSADLSKEELKWVSKNVKEVLLKFCGEAAVNGGGKPVAKQMNGNGYH